MADRLGPGLELLCREFRSLPWPREGCELLGEDLFCPENDAFSYRIVRPAKQSGPSTRLIFLFHGLNERSWDKYLPWAASLARKAGAAVLLFPLAFHMDRSPPLCADKDRVFSLYRSRRARLGPGGQASHVNAVLSQRLQERPLRFFSSGLQSYRDAAEIAARIRRGQDPDLAESASIDIFGYSIGVLLGQLLLMCDPGASFSRSRLFGFCGGASLDRARALSRAILDGGGESALSAFLRDPASVPGAASLAGEAEWDYFQGMAGSPAHAALRDRRLADIGGRISCLALARDEVFPFQGIRELLGERVRVEDFPYHYRHESPFPSSCPEREAVDEAREGIMARAAAFLAQAS